MRKLLSIITLSLSILSFIPTPALATQSQNYTSICKVSNVSLVTDNINKSQTLYQTTVINENGEEWILFSEQSLSGQWLNVYYNDNGTPDIIEDDSIYGYEILED